jgi:hypothetical protein
VAAEEATTGAVMLVEKWATLLAHAQTRKSSWPHGKRRKWPRTKVHRRRRQRRRRGVEVPVAVTRKAAMEAEVEENKRASV